MTQTNGKISHPHGLAGAGTSGHHSSGTDGQCLLLYGPLKGAPEASELQTRKIRQSLLPAPTPSEDTLGLTRRSLVTGSTQDSDTGFIICSNHQPVFFLCLPKNASPNRLSADRGRVDSVADTTCCTCFSSSWEGRAPTRKTTQQPSRMREAPDHHTPPLFKVDRTG